MKNTVRNTLLAALLLTSIPAAQAAIQNYSFNGALDSGHYIGQSFSGSFSFDDVGLNGSGNEWLAVSSLSMNLLSTTYTLADAAAQAEVAYFDGSFVGLSYSNLVGDPLFSLIAGSDHISQAFLAYDPSAGLSGTGSVIFTPVPEPETYALLLLGLGLLGAVSRRRAKAA